jgi:hypothetical protein
MPAAVAATRPVNPPGASPVLTEAQVWEGLGIKARQPKSFVAAITHIEVLKDSPNKVITISSALRSRAALTSVSARRSRAKCASGTTRRSSPKRSTCTARPSYVSVGYCMRDNPNV